MIRKLGVAVVVAALIHAVSVAAQAADPPSISVDGYGTLGLVYSDEDQADFVADLFAPEGAGSTDTVSPEVDSRLGLQFSTNVTSRLSGVVQIVAKQRYDDTYKPTVEWANLKYQATPDLSVRAGRMVLPVFMSGEYRNVGYALPWVRPPPEVYRIVPVTNVDGVDFSYRTRFAGVTNTLRGVYGGKDAETAFAGEVQSRNGLTLVDTLEWDALTLFAGYSRYDLTIEGINPFFDAFRQFGPEGEAIADRYDADDAPGELFSVGTRYDPGDWFVMGELAYSRSGNFIGDSRSWYLSGGYRIGSFTPYLTFADTEVTSNTSDPGLSLEGLPPPAAAQAAGLNTALNGLLSVGAEQKSVSIGVRWDFARNAALKVQYDHLDLDAGSAGLLINPQPGFQPGGTANLVSVAIDFVF